MRAMLLGAQIQFFEDNTDWLSLTPFSISFVRAVGSRAPVAAVFLKL